jgi:hypothetical protein
MKKGLFFIAMLCVIYVCSGQIELLKQVDGVVLPTIGEDEFYSYYLGENHYTNKIVIYDLNMNVKKTINININGIYLASISYVGKNIYTNSGKYEFIFYDNHTEKYYFCNEDGEYMYVAGSNTEIIIVRNRLIINEGWGDNAVSRVYSLFGNANKVINNIPSQFKTYPNPAMSNIKIQYAIDKMDVMNIYDMSGKVMESVFLSPSVNEIEIQVGNYSPGVYIYRHKDGSGKFIVQ